MNIKQILTLLSLSCWTLTNAQDIKPTSQGSTCQYCLPNGWTKDPGATNFFPSLSNETHYAGLANQPWSPLPDGPAPSYLGSFLSAYVSPTATATCHTSLTGLSPFKTYYLRYNIMSSKRASDPGYGESGTLELATVSNGIATPFASQTTTFTSGENTSKWISKVLKFTPTVSNVRLTFSGASTTGGFVNLDIGFNALTECLAGTDQVSLSATSIKAKCGKGADLTSLVQGNNGATVAVLWFTNPTHTGTAYAQPGAAGPGIYYAFKYHTTLECFNTDNSTAKVTVNASCFDLAPSLDINGLNFTPSASRDFILNVFETTGTATDTATMVRITKPNGFTITYQNQSGISNVLGGVPNENSSWFISETSNFITAVRNSAIQGNTKSVIGFKITRKNGTPKGLTQNITAVIIGGASNELSSSNNTTITQISTN